MTYGSCRGMLARDLDHNRRNKIAHAADGIAAGFLTLQCLHRRVFGKRMQVLQPESRSSKQL